MNKLDIVRFCLRSEHAAAKFLELYTIFKAYTETGRTHLRIKHIGDKQWNIADGTTSIDTFTPYRSLGYSKSIAWRLNELAEAYGHKHHYQIAPGNVVIDIGANVGEFSLFSASRGAKVYSFEPDADIFKLLQINAARSNAATPIQCFQRAISNSTGQQTFYLKPMQADSTLITPTENIDTYKQTQVDGIRLDDFIEANQLDVVDVIKCDAEGAEPEVVASAERALHKIKMFAFDCSPERNGNPTWREVMDYLQKHNFEIVSNPERSKRGLVAARNKAFP